MCCVEFLVKYILFFANLVFSLAGLALIVLGVVVIYQIESVIDLVPVNINTVPTVIIVVGCIVFLIAFFGCCGAIRESRCLLVMYAVCMVVLAAIKIWLTVVLFNYLDDVTDLVTDWLTTAFNTMREAFLALEYAFECCGTTGSDSYTNLNLPVLPPTCCATPTLLDQQSYCPLDQPTFSGCIGVVSDYLSTYGTAVGAVLIGIIVVELIAMLSALYLNHKATGKAKGTIA